MNHLWPVFIPSKGRPQTLLPKLLPTAVLVVEKEEEEAYCAEHPGSKICVLPESGKGIAFVRNWILDFNRAHKNPWFWMLDDDIKGFYATVNRRNAPLPAEECLLTAQKLVETVPMAGQAALEYQQYAWSATKDLRVGGYADVCVAVNTRYTSLCRYRPEMNLKEDRDFTLQVLSNGAQTVRCSKLSFSVPANGSNAGGLKDLYETSGAERGAVDRMIKAWGTDICEAQVKPNGRYDLKIHWSYFKK